MCAPPTIYRLLVTNDSLEKIRRSPFKSLAHCVSAGEPLNASVIVDWHKATGITIKDGWGQTETVRRARPVARNDLEFAQKLIVHVRF